MGSLFGGLNSSVDAIRAFESALNTSQNNVSNSSTPGYARQVADLQSLNFNLPGGLTGGVQAGAVHSTQDEYANQAVRNQLGSQASYTAQSGVLNSVQSLFDVSGQTGVVGALNNLFQSFSAWSTSSGSAAAQQDVLTKASALASAFRSTSNTLDQIRAGVNMKIGSTVQQINNIAASIASDNAQILQNVTPDAGLDAKLHASLETLSGLGDVTVRFEQNGTATVLLGGETPLVLGATASSITANPSGSISDSNGQDITSEVSGGTLGGLLNVTTSTLDALQGRGSTSGQLDLLAQKVADRVNQILTSGQTTSGQAGVPLFTYNSAADAAGTLAVDPAVKGSALAPVDPGPPAVSNGAALSLANLGNSTASTDQIGGQSILQFFSSLAVQTGQQTSNAQDNQTLHTQLLTQAQALQTQISGVSLDAEAVNVMELQKGYQAAGKMVSVIDTLANTLISMVL